MKHEVLQKSKKIIKSVRQKFKKHILFNRKLISKLSCVELKDVAITEFIMWKDDPIAFKNIFSSVLMYRKSVRQINDFKNRPNNSFSDWWFYLLMLHFHTWTLIISIVATTSLCYWLVTAKFNFWFIGMSEASMV